MSRIEDELERLKRTTLHERECWARDETVAGMDEAGRGPLAGPVVAACAVMPPEPLIPYVKDSKQLTEKRREELYGRITETALAFGVGIVSPEEIDRINILAATKKAFRIAYAEMGFTPDLVLTDAIEGLNLPVTTRSFVGGDKLCYCVAAASIIAKVTRDRLMREMDEIYPGYGFAQHKGYGTKAHYEAIGKLGPCGIHRASFLRNAGHTPSNNANSEKGGRGEAFACVFLRKKGFEIIATNYHSRCGELDIVARHGETLVFVEVKARSNDKFGSGREAVTPSKQAKLVKAAQHFLSAKGANNAKARFDVIEVDLNDGSVVHLPDAFSS